MTRNDLRTMLVGVAGAAAVTIGMALLHPAAGWISGGVFALAWSLLAAQAAARSGQEGG